MNLICSTYQGGLATIMNKVFGVFKSIGTGTKKVVYDKPKQFITASVRRKVIASAVGLLASILVLYGYELPADIQNNLTSVVDALISIFVQ